METMLYKAAIAKREEAASHVAALFFAKLDFDYSTAQYSTYSTVVFR